MKSSGSSVSSENKASNAYTDSSEKESNRDLINGSMKSKRPNLPALNLNRDSLIFQLIDVTHREIEGKLHIFMFGVTSEGNSVCCTVNGFFTYFYASIKDETEMQQRQSLEAHPSVKAYEIVERYNLYNYQGEKKIRFMKIIVTLPSEIRDVRLKCFDENIKLFEEDVSLVMRFMVETKIDGCNWVELPPSTWRLSSSKRSFCQLDVETDYNEHKFISHDWPKIAPFRVLSLDIISERSSEAGKKLQVASVIFNQGHPEAILKKVFTLKECTHIVGVDFESFTNEQGMLILLRDFIQNADPDIVTAYGIDIKCLKNISRLYNVSFFRKDKPAEGYVLFDLQKIIQKKFNLRYGTLSAASCYFFKISKEHFDYNTIASLFSGNNETRHRLAKYALQNATLSMKLINELKLVEHYMEISRVSGVTLDVALNQGEKIKVYNQLLKTAARRDFILPTRFNETRETFAGGSGLYSIRGYHADPIAVLDFASMSSNIIITYNLCYTTLLDPEKGKDVNISDADKWRSPENHEFVKANIRKGLLPEILENLLRLRGSIKDTSILEKDPNRKKILEYRQSAIKLLANAIYGYTGIKEGKTLSCIPVASSITAYGRKILDDTRQEIELIQDAKIIYGDTDSVMVSFGDKSMEECISLAQNVIKRISDMCQGSITLKYENIYWPYLLLATKQYCGVKYVQSRDKGELVMKGIKAVHRGCPPLVTNLTKICLQKLLIERNLEGATRHAKQIISDLLCNRIDISQLVITKELTKTEYAAKQAHVELAIKMKKRDPGTAPKLGDRVPYVICCAAKNTPAYMKAEDPIYALENCVPIDSKYYLDNQLTKPLLKIFKPFLGDKAESILLEGEHTRTRTVVTSKVGALAVSTQKREKCLGCKALLPNGHEKNALCPHCEPQRSALYQQELTVQRTLEENFSRLCSECQRCQGSLHEEVLCRNGDCPIFYMRNKTQIELDMQQRRIFRFGGYTDW